MSALLCRIELNKTGGIIVTVDNKDGSITHTLVLNSDSITTTSKGQSATSTIIQTPEKISINCKTFELTTEKIICTSSKSTSLLTDGDFCIVSGKDTGIDATNIKLTGSNEISATASLIKLQ
jgi:hypothetical protein